LYGVAALVGILSVFFDVAYQSFLPSLVEREQIVEGNSKLGVSESLAEIAGPPLGGVLVQLISGPITILLDALSFLFSAFALRGIRAGEPPSTPPEQRRHGWHDLTTGLRLIWADPLLRPLAGRESSSTSSAGSSVPSTASTRSGCWAWAQRCWALLLHSAVSARS
jgi:hypothetical protein